MILMFARRGSHFAVACLAAVVASLLMVGCSATPTSPAPPSATPSAVATTSPTAEPTPTPEPTPSPTPFPFASIDGLVCTGTWTNHTFGATGPISITFDLSSSSSVILELSGKVFGGAGGRLVLPVKISGSTLRIAGEFGFLGTVDVVLKARGTVTAVLTDPPALGSGFQVTVTKFSLKSGKLSIESKTVVNHITLATSTVSAKCGRQA